MSGGLNSGLAFTQATDPDTFLDQATTNYALQQQQSEEVAQVSRAIEAAERAQASAKARTAEVKPRFDFYKILPGTEEAVTDKEFKRTPPASSKEVYFLQVAAFQMEDPT